MAFVDLHFFSEALGMQTSAYVVIPQDSSAGEIGVDRAEQEGKEAAKFKCLYLLHGLSDDHTIWLRRTSIERYADEYGICVVMPAGDASFYTDMVHGKKYYTYIAHELPQRICRFFNVSGRREDNYIAGLSMGGYGALKIGLRDCDRFSAAAGLSACADVSRVREMFPEVAKNVFGENNLVQDADNLFALAEAMKANSNRPRIYLGIGTEDFLYEDNQRFKAHLEKLSYDFVYRESKGNHNWAFWDEYIQYVLEWMFRR